MGTAHSSPWRETSLFPEISNWNTTTETELRQRCNKDLLDCGHALGKQKVKILMFGLTQDGKSSLVNSMLSAITGKIHQYGLDSRLEYSVTRSLHSPQFLVEGETVNFLLTDMPGIFKDQGPYAKDYIQAVLKGHIKEDVDVPNGPLDKTADYYIQKPEPFDAPCCVVLVMRADKPVSDEIKNKFQLVINEAKTTGLKVAVVLTHVDKFAAEWERLNLVEKAAHYVFSPLFLLTNNWPSLWSSAHIRGREVRKMFHSSIVHEAVKQANCETGISIGYIHPVVNYTGEVETTTEMNILHLYTLSKILDLAEEGAKFRLLSLSSSP